MGLIRGGNRATFAALVAAMATLFCLSAVSSAEAGIGCRYQPLPPDGPGGNQLRIRVSSPEEVVALLPGPGGSIRVTDDQRMKPIRCGGRRPTMTNIDRVLYLAGHRTAWSTLYVDQAPKFGPGATPAEAGGKGITFIAKGPGISFGIGGTDLSDAITMGQAGKATALDFFPDYFPGPGGDAIDARIYAKTVGLVVKAGGGPDLVAGSQFDYAATNFDGPLKAPVTIYGEAGADNLAGGVGMDYLDGGGGDDTLNGAAGADQLFGGPGKDVFLGGPGRDEIDAIDRRGGEQIFCGAGRDLVEMDLKDRDHGCETFRFP